MWESPPRRRRAVEVSETITVRLPHWRLDPFCGLVSGLARPIPSQNLIPAISGNLIVIHYHGRRAERAPTFKDIVLHF
jgi:hypothetical protein